MNRVSRWMKNGAGTFGFFVLFCLPGAVETAGGETRVRGTVVDAVTGKRLAARIHVNNDRGCAYLVDSVGGMDATYRREPERLPESSEVHTAVSGHPFEVRLAPGSYTFRVERGKEYLSLEKTVTVNTTPVELTFPLQRWIDMAKRGWYSGDTHVHRTIAELAVVMPAEDLNVAFPLTSWVTKADVPPTRGDRSAGSIDANIIKLDETHVIFPRNTEYEIFTVGSQRHTLGAVFVLNHQTPLEIGAPPVQPIARLAREQGALLDLDKHSWPWSLMLVPVMDIDLFELANNHVWQTRFGFHDWTIDKVPAEMQLERTADGRGLTEWGWIEFGFKTYYALLNCGFHMRVSAGTASGVHPVQVGFGRVYVHLPAGFTPQDWLEGLNAGHSFVSTGPMLGVTFNERDPGASFKGGAEGFQLEIAGDARAKRPLDRIEIVVNGKVQATVVPTNRVEGHAYVSKVDLSLDLETSSWIAVRCFESHPQGRVRFAHTNPVFVIVDDKPVVSGRAEVAFFVNRMKEELERNRGVTPGEALAEYEQALKAYEAVLRRAYP